jgi:hypothetical protein
MWWSTSFLPQTFFCSHQPLDNKTKNGLQCPGSIVAVFDSLQQSEKKDIHNWSCGFLQNMQTLNIISKSTKEFTFIYAVNVKYTVRTSWEIMTPISFFWRCYTLTIWCLWNRNSLGSYMTLYNIWPCTTYSLKKNLFSTVDHLKQTKNFGP